MRNQSLRRFLLGIGLLWMVLICNVENVIAQTNVGGMVLDNNKLPISNASVLLLHVKDSTLQKGVTTNADGAFLLQEIPEGHYFLVCSYTGMQDHYSSHFQLGKQAVDMGSIDCPLWGRNFRI